MALPSPTALVGAVVLANVLSVGVLLLLYTNFELLRAYLRPILWALLWALALFPVKERWTHALRRAYTDGPFALLPWHPCATHQPEGPRAVAQRDTPCAKPTRVGSFWTGLWIATGGYVVLNSAVARTALGVFAFALCASPQCLQLTSRFCTHGLRDSTSRLVAAAAHFAAVSVAGGCAALPWHTLPRSLTGSYQSMCGYASVFSSCLVAVGHLTARILVLSLRAGTACACACVRVAATAIPVEDGVAAILTFGLLISVVAGAALLGIQVALEWVDVALALRAATTAALAAGGAHLGALQAPIIAYAASVQDAVNVTSTEDAVRVLQGWTAGVDVDSTVESGLDWIDSMWPNETVYIRQAWVAFKAYNESLAVATQDADEATRVLMEAANHSTLMVDPCQCPQIPTTPCEEGSDDNESNKKGTCAAPAFMRADLDSAARDPENSCTCQAPDVSIRGDADAAVTSPPPECGFDVEILGSDPGFTAAVYRGVAILRKVVLRAPSALADPDCWWAIASAAWNGDSSPPDIEPSASDNGAGNAALLSWIPAWAQPWAHQAESLLHQQTVPGKKGHPTGAGALKSLAAYLPSTGHLAAWSETVVAHGSAIAAGFAASAGVAFARLAAAGAVFIDAAISALLFVNILFYLLSAPKPWLQLMLEAILSTEGAASTLELLTGNVSTLLAVNAQAAAFNGLLTYILVGVVAQAHVATSCALLASLAAVLPFFPVVLTVIPAAVEGVLRFSSPIFGVAAGITLLVTHYVTLSSFRDAQLADAADRGLAASHAGVLGLTIIAGMAALGPEGAILGPLAVSLLACCGVLLARSRTSAGRTDSVPVRPGQ